MGLKENLVDVSSLDENGFVALKFVKVGDEYRFFDVMKKHSSFVEKEEIGNVQGAGSVFLSPGRWSMPVTSSMTLKNLGAKNHFVTPEIDLELEQIFAERTRVSPAGY